VLDARVIAALIMLIDFVRFPAASPMSICPAFASSACVAEVAAGDHPAAAVRLPVRTLAAFFGLNQRAISRGRPASAWRFRCWRPAPP
jgi:hypothetical protein